MFPAAHLGIDQRKTPPLDSSAELGSATRSMPTYEYECAKCKKDFEIFQSMKDDALAKCPKEKCRMKTWGKGKVKRKLGVGAPVSSLRVPVSTSPTTGARATKSRKAKPHRRQMRPSQIHRKLKASPQRKPASSSD